MVHGANVVEHLVYVLRPAGQEHIGFGGEHILQRALGAFDLAGEYGLLADIHSNE